jgi:hypothetical protein
MKVILIRAIRNMFVGQIDLKPQPFKTELLDGKYYVSSIELRSEHDKETHHFTLVLSEPLLKEVCSVLLFEDEPDEATLKDMGTEVANQVIGNAKVLVESVKQEELLLSIPKVEDNIALESVVKDNKNLILFKFNDNNAIWFLMSRETIKD